MESTGQPLATLVVVYTLLVAFSRVGWIIRNPILPTIPNFIQCVDYGYDVPHHREIDHRPRSGAKWRTDMAAIFVLNPARDPPSDDTGDVDPGPDFHWLADTIWAGGNGCIFSNRRYIFSMGQYRSDTRTTNEIVRRKIPGIEAYLALSYGFRTAIFNPPAEHPVSFLCAGWGNPLLY